MNYSKAKLCLIAPNLATYPQGGGHWSWFLQYTCGLRQLGVDFYWLEFIERDKYARLDKSLIMKSLKRIERFGFAHLYRLVVHTGNRLPLDDPDSIVYGGSQANLAEIISNSDAAWSFAGAGPAEILALFQKTVLIDGDPGTLQVSALQHGKSFDVFDKCCTVGLNIGSSKCQVPLLGRTWKTFPQVVHLPLWERNRSNPTSVDLPITTISHWGWSWVEFEGRLLSLSKKDRYLKYLRLPELTQRCFEIAAQVMGPDEGELDADLLRRHNWNIANPYLVASTVGSYQNYIGASSAEICCPKPVYQILNTGWMSDRSAAYLASGKPVLMEDTGLSLPTTATGGMLLFSDLESAVEATKELFADYHSHAKNALVIAEEVCSSMRVLPMLLQYTFE